MHAHCTHMVPVLNPKLGNKEKFHIQKMSHLHKNRLIFLGNLNNLSFEK